MKAREIIQFFEFNDGHNWLYPYKIPYILESNPRPFYILRAKNSDAD